MSKRPALSAIAVSACLLGLIGGCVDVHLESQHSKERTASTEDESRAEFLAKLWIDYWNEGRPDDIPLADAFVHTSPFGRIEGRENYLQTVKPMALRNVTSLTILRTMAQSNQAVVHFEMLTPQGPVQACDWITVEDDQIAEIHSFYDATRLRYQE